MIPDCHKYFDVCNFTSTQLPSAWPHPCIKIYEQWLTVTHHWSTSIIMLDTSIWEFMWIQNDNKCSGCHREIFFPVQLDMIRSIMRLGGDIDNIRLYMESLGFIYLP